MSSLYADLDQDGLLRTSTSKDNETDPVVNSGKKSRLLTPYNVIRKKQSSQVKGEKQCWFSSSFTTSTTPLKEGDTSNSNNVKEKHSSETRSTLPLSHPHKSAALYGEKFVLKLGSFAKKKKN